MLVNCTLIVHEVEQKLANPSSYNGDDILENLANLDIFSEPQEVASREGRQFQDDAFVAPNAFPVQQPQSPQPSFRDISGRGPQTLLGFGGGNLGGFGNQQPSVS